jgi:hypothetical protein
MRRENSLNWRPLGTLIRDRAKYSIVILEQQHKSKLLYTTRHIEMQFCLRVAFRISAYNV